VEVVAPPSLHPAFDNYAALAAALGLEHWVLPARAVPGAAGAGASFAVEPSLVVRTLERALGLGEPRTRREGEGPASGSTSDEEELCGQY